MLEVSKESYVTKSKWRKARHMLEALIATSLSIIQYIPVVGMWHGVMFLPLAVYIFSLLAVYPKSFWTDANFLLFSNVLLFGRIVAFCGFTIFLMACFQFLRKRGVLITTRLYSFVRHPQYFGIIVLSLGISIMCMQIASNLEIAQKVLLVWLIQVLGYVALAFFEERYLLREYGEEYQRYKQKVPFIFPIPHPSDIPESIFSIILSIIVAFLCIFIFV